VIRLRYEDVVREPVRSLRNLAEELSLEDDATWSASLSSLPISDRNDRWKEHLDGPVLDSITEIQGPVLTRYGYAI
jgi:hypothetical protein